MISLFRGLRSVLILAAAGVLFGAFLMFWEAILMLVDSFRMARLNPDMSVIVAVLRATDKILLGIVLMVVGCGIALGFALDIPPEQRSKLPQWMIIDTVAELKNLFFQMIILYLVVHFAAQVGEMQMPLQWEALVLPISALLLAGAMKLTASSHHLAEGTRSEKRSDHTKDVVRQAGAKPAEQPPSE
ncbi:MULTISPECIES: YqhA family protein [Rhizobium/Agrobacterium group]|uniref:YqhA family protein n=1 Tax=Rhizobium/Agrobacterium group TaxID=227290 RepID=UPI001F34446C|nr:MULTISPECIES: YqhA family protein [Rhizobium/Agrobacterium group]MDA5634988.1 YqhA family protein [Agrobacterium sp. ST15.16.024]MDF1890136.1 YqhA family protein [Rhizobium rhizogenes]